MIGPLVGLGRVWWWCLPRNDDEAHRIAINGFDCRNRNFHVVYGKRLVVVVDYRDRSSGSDERAADLKKVASVAGELWLE